MDLSMLHYVPVLMDHGVIILPPGQRSKKQEYESICSDELRAAVYRPVKPGKSHPLSRNAMSLAELLHLAEKDLPKVLRLITRLRYKHNTTAAFHAVYYESLELLYCVEEIYASLPGACVDLRVTALPIPDSHRAQLFRKPILSNVFPIARDLSCIVFFETGELELDPDKLEGVLALSHNNSIFAAAQLLDDPVSKGSKNLVRRLTGNIGRPGFALLIPPHDPRIQEYDFHKYVIEHESFDRELLDSFEATSLHLSLTGYELPLDLEPRGDRDSTTYFMETNVSLYNGGEWVGDLDIINAKKA